MNFKPFWLLKEPGTIGVCAWCCPGGAEAFFASYPMFRGKKLSHGICPAHRAEIEAEVDGLAQVIAKPIAT